MQILPPNFIHYNKIKFGVINFFFDNKKIIIPFLFVLFFISFYFLIDFSAQSLVAHDEGLYARRAKLFEYSNNWFSPPFTSPHHKTLGSYWLIALSINLFGKSELALRLPSILSSFICLICSYLISLKITNKKTALISLFSLSSMPLWIQYSRYASPDFPFLMCILFTILFFLNSLDHSEDIRQYFYIFLSGFFISISFFVRSYMVFVPLIGLTPFMLYHLYQKKYSFRIFFSSGIFIGAIPTCLNLYFAFQRYGSSGITTLFNFARKQAVGEVGFNNTLLLPLNFLYLTFPTGVIFILLLVFTKSNIKIKYPLLVYLYPLLSLTLLLCMSTSYSHYYIFLLPSLSIIFATYITSNTFRYSFSKYTIISILFIIIIFISFFLLFSIIYYKDLLIQYSYGNPLTVYILISFLCLSYLISIKSLIDLKKLRYNLTIFFFTIIIPQYISISMLFNFGIIGNPNHKTKLFLNDKDVSLIIKTNTIVLHSVESKTKTLLSYYLPSSKVVKDVNEIGKYKYIITSNSNFIEQFNLFKNFSSVNKFDNHILLMNISK